MKINQRINRSFIYLLVIVIFASATTSIYTLNSSLLSYIHTQRNKEFEAISTDISNIIQSDNNVNNFLLENYVSKNNIMLKYFDTKNKLLAEFNGIDNYTSYSKESLASQRYLLKNQSGQDIGSLEISYIDDIYEYDKSIKDFTTAIFQKYGLIFLISMVIASILTILVSRNITDPIREIQDQTKELRHKKYNKIDKRYNVYELDQLASDINYLSTTLEMQEQYRSDYAKDIAHELRTPMTNLLLHLEGIRDEIIEADPATISLLISEVKRLNTMIDNLQTSFTSTEEMAKLNLEKVNVVELLKNIAHSFQPLMEDKQIHFSQEFDKETIIETDRDKFVQIFSNLLSNAIKAVSEEKGKISIVHKTFKNREVVRIIDNGVGISEEDQEHIFERFYRVDNARNTKLSGHGLGLAITKTYLDLLNYKVSINSSLGKGSEFIITIFKTI